MSYRFYRDDDGVPRAETARGECLLGRFLESDMQGSVGMCDEVLDVLDDIAAGRRQRWQRTGNAHTIFISKRRARIQAEFGRAVDLVLTPAELRQALLGWKALLGSRPPRRCR